MSDLDLGSFRLWPKGHAYEDFAVGQRFEHHWGRTVTEADNVAFTTAILWANPLSFNREYARAAGHPDVVVCPMLVFATVFGLTVEDLSESGGLFLGLEDLAFHATVYPGDTLTASSEVVAMRESTSRPSEGIVTWHTEGHNQRGDVVVEYRRTNLVAKRGG